ncbi:MAG: hypothetical protein CME61_06195 [Halobacteriovoraceae bacterium]|nr:hypothetical protein [Halobacteriovoraceae bacterium]
MAIGDELLKGETQDKNLYWFGQFLRSIGHQLEGSLVCKDTTEEISNGLNLIINNTSPELIVVSGGLGPTKDDVTKMGIKDFLKTDLIEDEKTKEYVTDHYQRYGKTWDPNLNHYHMIPKGVAPVKNPCGLAPGLFFHSDKTSILCAPGVPREFEFMVKEFFHGHYKEKINANANHIYIRTRGVPEEKIFNEISPNLWDELSQVGSVSSYPRLTGIDILVDQIDDAQVEKIKELPSVKLLSPFIWQIGNLELNEYVIKKLKEKNLTVATAESCTGGLVASSLTDVSGSSDVFIGSIVSYSNDIKMDHLEVSPLTLEKKGAVSDEVAKQMAIGVREKFDVNISVSTSGIAGPSGGSLEKPVGTVAVGISFSGGDFSKTYVLRDEGRTKTKKRFTTCALLSLLHFIETI